MLGIIERYRRHHCLSLETAQRTDDPKVKKQMLGAAELWRELAEKELKNWNDPVYRAKQRLAERERKLAEIDAAIAAFNRSNAAHSEQTKTQFAESGVEQLQQVLESGPDGRQ
jgi:hypothetical protein